MLPVVVINVVALLIADYTNNMSFYHYRDIDILVEAGYDVVERNPWHYQVMAAIGKKIIVVNIWPSKRKYMREYGDGAKLYADIIEAVESIIRPKKKNVLIAREMFTELMKPLENAQRHWRSELDEWWWGPLYTQ